MTRVDSQQALPPRLLNKKQAAAYLGYKTTLILDRLDIRPISIATVGGRYRELYDRLAIDSYLNIQSGIANIGEIASIEEDDPDEAFRRWDEGRKAHAA